MSFIDADFGPRAQSFFIVNHSQSQISIYYYKNMIDYVKILWYFNNGFLECKKIYIRYIITI